MILIALERLNVASFFQESAMSAKPVVSWIILILLLHSPIEFKNKLAHSQIAETQAT